MRILLTTIGSHGDVHPFIAMGKALRARGHEVAVLVQPLYRQVVLDAGLEHIPLGEEAVDLSIIADNPAMMSAWRGPPIIIRDLCLPQAPNIFRAVEDAIVRDKFELVLTHQICFGAQWACEKHGAPAVVASLSPLAWASREDILVTSPISPDNPSAWFRALTRLAFKPGVALAFDRVINRARRDLGLPSRRNAFFAEARGGVLNLGLWSPHFRGPFPDDPAHSRICGFTWFDADKDRREPAPEIEEFLREGEPPILFTLGSTAIYVAGPFYSAAAEACRRLGRRGMLLVGKAEYAPRDLPPGVRAFTYAPHSMVMPRACANVVHGGVGTTAQALRAGRPMIVVPFAHDQFDNAARVKRLGVSATVKRSRLSADTLEAALRSVLGRPEVAARAGELRAKLTNEDGAEQAVDAIEAKPWLAA